MLSKIPKRQGNTKINEHVNSEFYNWILLRSQNVQYPIANHCIKVTIDGETTLQLVPKLSLQASVRYLQNDIVRTIEEECLKEAR